MQTAVPRLRGIRWMIGGAAFATAAILLFETAGLSSPNVANSNAYQPVSLSDADVRAALAYALADQKKKNRADSLVLLEVVSAERQSSHGDNFRLCLSLERHGRGDTVRTVVHRDAKQRWSVALWAWGACR